MSARIIATVFCALAAASKSRTTFWRELSPVFLRADNVEIGMDIASKLPVPVDGFGGTLMSLHAAVSSWRWFCGAFSVDAVELHAANNKPDAITHMITRLARVVIMKHSKHRVSTMKSKHRARIAY